MSKRIKQGIFTDTPQKRAMFEETLKKFQGTKDGAVSALEEVQEIYGYLPEPVLKELAIALDKSVSELYSIGTFYSQFTLYPKGKYDISVCLGTACYINGSKAILERFMEKLGIAVGQCTEDGLFSISEMRCVGCCSVAPVVTVNGKIYGKATLKDVDKIIAEYKATEAAQ